MQFATGIILLALAASGYAQFGSLPDCAKSCANNALPQSCQGTDIKCICSDSAFVNGISCCVSKSCSPADQQKTLQVAQQLCNAVQVNLPSAASCSASAGASSAASGAASGASMSASGMTSGASSAAVNTASGATSMASGMSSSAASGASTASSSAAGAATGSSSAKTPSSTGGADQLGSRMGAIGAAVAALALL